MRFEYTTYETITQLGKPLEELTKEELLLVIDNLSHQLRNSDTELRAIERTVSKFLAKDHPSN